MQQRRARLFELEMTSLTSPSSRVELDPRARLHHLCAAQHAVRRGNVGEAKVQPDRVRRGPQATAPRVRKNLIVLGCEHDTLCGAHQIDRLDARMITRHQQAFLERVVEREREHPVESSQRVATPLHQRAQHHFGIARGPEAHAAQLEIATNFAVVVQLAVEHQRVAAIAGEHRLMSVRRQIDDRQPSKHERATFVVGPLALVVGAASRHQIADARPVGARRHRREPEFTGYAAHRVAVGSAGDLSRECNPPSIARADAAACGIDRNTKPCRCTPG